MEGERGGIGGSFWKKRKCHPGKSVSVILREHWALQ